MSKLTVYNNKQIFYAFLFNIRNYSLELSDTQRREMELNIILLRVNNFDIKQKSAWNICFIIYPQHQTISWMNADKAKQFSVTAQLSFLSKWVQL